MSRLDKHAELIGPTLPERAFRPVGKHMTLEGGSGGGGSSTNYTSGLPEYAKPYFTDVMGRAQEASVQPYQAYGGDRVAGTSPFQNAAYGMTSDLAQQGTPAGLQAGQQLTGFAAGNLAGYNYDPAQFGIGYDMQDSNTVQSFMSPYKQNVIDVEKEAAVRDFQMAQQGRNAQQVAAGAFGGSRGAVENAEAQRNLMGQLGAIQATGTQSAFENAQQALQAQREAYMGAQGQTEASRQFGARTGLEAAQGLGQMGAQLGAMGEAEQDLALKRANAMQAVGRDQQEQAQRELDQAYQDFAAQRDYEQSMINWYTGVLYGQPMEFDRTVYQPQGNLASQIAGAGIAGLGLYGSTR